MPSFWQALSACPISQFLLRQRTKPLAKGEHISLSFVPCCVPLDIVRYEDQSLQQYNLSHRCVEADSGFYIKIERGIIMNTELVVLITVIVCFAVFAGALYLIQYLSKHGLTAAGIEKIEAGVTMASAVASAIKPCLPGYADNVIDMVLKYAQEGVERAEATYKAALAADANANDTRAAEAETWIKNVLALQGISITADVQKLIDAVTPLFVRALPPTHATTGTEK